MFPNGQPAKIAWGFLKLLRTRDQQPNFGRLQVQLYKFPGEAQGLVGALTKTAFNNWADQKDVVGDLAVFARGRRVAIKHAPALRPLYPAHVNVTVAAAPRGGAATAAPQLPGTTSRTRPRFRRRHDPQGVSSRRRRSSPGRDEGADRARAHARGRVARRARRARAPPADEAAEVTETLGRLPYETLCYGMDADAAAAARGATPMKAAIVTAIKQGEDPDGARREAGGRPGKPVIVKLPHARERHDDCEIPNGEARTADPSGSRARVRPRVVRSARAQTRRSVQGGLHVHGSNFRHGHRSVHRGVRRSRKQRVRRVLGPRSRG